MAYFNWPNTTPYPKSTYSEHDGYLSQVLAFEQVDASAPETSTNGWSASGQQSYDDVARWPTSLYPEVNLASTSSSTQTQGYDRWIYPACYLPRTEQYTQPDYTIPNYASNLTTSNSNYAATSNYTAPNYTTPNYITSNYTTPTYITPTYTTPSYITQNHATPSYATPNYGASASTATLEAPELLPALDSSQPSPLLRDLKEGSARRSQIDGEGDQSGQIADTPCENSQTSHRPSGSSVRTRSMTKRRYQPYAPPRAHPSDERTNAEAGPSNPVAPSIPNVASPPTDPSGGISEATADAENTDSNTEENVTPRKTRRPRGTGRARPARHRNRGHVQRLCTWAQRWETLAKSPTHTEALTIVLEVVKELRPVPVSDKPTLAGGYGPQKEEKDKKKSPNAVREDTRRNGIKGLYAELSRYYELPEGTKKWGRPKLRIQILHEIESLISPPATPSP